MKSLSINKETIHEYARPLEQDELQTVAGGTLTKPFCTMKGICGLTGVVNKCIPIYTNATICLKCISGKMCVIVTAGCLVSVVACGKSSPCPITDNCVKPQQN